MDSVSEQLRRVLADLRNPHYRQHLDQIRNSQQRLTNEAFRLLFEHDTTWGLFGQRHPHWNDDLGVVALTQFLPHERETANDADDVILLLTPIYRVLCTLTAMTLKEARFEGFGARPLVLPQRPRPGIEIGRYESLLDVACSLWLQVCHAYVALADPWRVRELYCFNVDQTRAQSLWLDFDRITFVPTVRHTTLESSRLTEPLCLVLGPEEGVEDSSAAPAGPLVCLHTLISEPWIELAWIRDDAVLFLLLTVSGGNFVSFHRAVRGRVRRYPLYIHATADDPAAAPPMKKCAVCGRSGTPSAPLMRNDMDPELGNLYCNRACIAQMEHVRQVKARFEEDKRRAEAIRLNLPPIKPQ